jgi:hypothetical protein
MLNDPIVDEVHRIREKLLEECGGDIDKLFDRIVAFGAKFPNQVHSPQELREIADKRDETEPVSK